MVVALNIALNVALDIAQYFCYTMAICCGFPLFWIVYFFIFCDHGVTPSFSTPQRAIPLPYQQLSYHAYRRRRWGVVDYVLFVLWRPFLWLKHRYRWRVRVGQFREAIYRELHMPPDPHPDYLELGTFRPADSLELITRAADLRIQQIRAVLGVNIFHPINHRTIQEKLFHTWDDFAVRQKQFDSPTRTEEVDFGHSLNGFAVNREGYLAYLKQRAPDLYAFLQRPFPARIPVRAFKMHAWILGMTGAGKSELIKVLVAQLIKQPRATVIVLDPERKLGEELAWSRDHLQGDRLIYIDPTLGRNHGLYPILNPLEYPSPDLDEQATYAEMLVDAMREAIKGEITERMETLLTGCLRVLLRREGSTLLDLQRFMDKARNGDLVELGQAHPDPLVRDFFCHSFLQSDWNKTKDPLAAKLQTLLSRPAFANCVMGHRSIHMEQLITSHKTVVLVLDEGELGTLGAKMLGTFFVAMLESTIRRMRSGSRAQANPDPVYLIPDEFQRFVTPRFGQILTRARRLGLHLIAANQYVGQEGMSRELAENMEINTNVRMVGLYSSMKHAKKAAEMVGIAAEDLARLGSGKYAIRAGKQPPLVVQVESDRLGHSNSMTAEQWHTLAAQQLQEHYRAPFTAAEQATPPPVPITASSKAQKSAQSPASTPQPVRPIRKPKFPVS
jgi:hypothetical protein